MKRITPIVLLALMWGLGAADPIPPPGMRSVTHDQTLTGSGLAAGPLGLAACASAGQAWVWNGAAFVCANAGGVTNSAGANAITKSDGTNIVASSLTDNGTVVGATAEPLDIGQLNGTDISAAPTALQQNWAPTGLAGATGIRTTNTSAAIICGIAGGVAGRQLWLHVTGTGNVTLANNDNGADSCASTAGNFILTGTGQDMRFSQSGNVLLVYDGTTAAWRMATGVVTASTGLTYNTIGLAVDTTVIQALVSGTCAAPNAIRIIASNGSVTCTTANVQTTGTTTAGDLAVFGSPTSGITNYGGNTCGAGFATAISAAGTLTCSTPSGLIGGLTSGTVPVASSSSSLTNSSMVDDGTTVTLQGEKGTLCTSSAIGTGGVVTLTIPAGCTTLVWTPTVNASLVGITHPSSGSRNVTVYESNASGGNVSIYTLNSNAASADQIEGDISGTSGGWTTVNTAIAFRYDTTTSKWFTNWTGDIGSLNVNGQLYVTASALIGGYLECSAADCFWIALASISSGNQNLNIDAAGTGIIRFNSGTGSVTNSGTGGYLFESGGSSPTNLVAIAPGAQIEVVTQNPSATTTSQNYGVQSNTGGTANTTSAGVTMFGVASSVVTSISSGSNPLDNIALYGNATSGTTNEALETGAGNVILNKTSGNTVIGVVGTNAQYTLLGQQVFTSSGTYTPNAAGVRFVKVEMCGGGGGGGGADLGAGGASGAVLQFTLAASAITGGTVTDGTAGTAGANAGGTGGTGGDTSVVINSTTYTAKGGTGGAATSTVAVSTIIGGKVQTGSSSVTGGTIGGWQGGFATALSTGIYESGAGGSSPYGVGGAALNTTTTTAGNAATGFCAGGGGASGTTGSATGGAGTAGLVIIYEYR